MSVSLRLGVLFGVCIRDPMRVALLDTTRDDPPFTNRRHYHLWRVAMEATWRCATRGFMVRVRCRRNDGYMWAGEEGYCLDR